MPTHHCSTLLNVKLVVDQNHYGWGTLGQSHFFPHNPIGSSFPYGPYSSPPAHHPPNARPTHTTVIHHPGPPPPSTTSSSHQQQPFFCQQQLTNMGPLNQKDGRLNLIVNDYSSLKYGIGVFVRL